jgi:hypothetical protein
MSDNCVKCVVNPRTRTDLLCETCGKEKDDIAAAKAAIHHVLNQVRDHPAIGYYMGHGTQSFELLTKAAAALWNEPLDKVRDIFEPTNPKDPRDQS